MPFVRDNLWSTLASILTAGILSNPIAFAQECGSPVDFGVVADSWTDTQRGADCGIVIEGDDIVAVTSFNILIFDRDGNLNGQRSRETPEFFNDLDLDFEADPFCIFDPDSERWFFLCLTSVTDFGLAVSKSATLDLYEPEDWYAYEWDPSPLNFLDYPSMIVGEDHVFFTITANYVNNGSAIIAYADKADLLDGGNPPALTAFSITSISGQDNTYLRNIGCVRQYEEINSGYGYFITDSHTDPDGEVLNDMVRL